MIEREESVERTAAETTSEAFAEEPELARHPGPMEYVRIAVVLAIATAAEVGLYYITALPDPVYVALLFFFMIVKFSLVALWFMHLKFDSRIFRRLFVTGILLAAAVYVIVLLTFGVFIG